MIRLFRQVNVFSIVFFLLFGVLLRISYVFSPMAPSTITLSPLSELTFYIIDQLQGGATTDLIIGIVLCLIQGVWLNHLLETHGYFSKRNFLPAFIYLILACLFPSFLGLHPALLANTFFIPALGQLIVFQQQREAVSPIFDATILVSIGSLFYFPLGATLLFILWILILFRSFRLKNWLIVLLGFLLPYFWVATYFFWRGELTSSLQSYLFPFFASFSIHFETHWLNSGVLFLSGLFILRSLWHAQVTYLRSVVKHRNIQIILTSALFFTTLSVLLHPDITYYSFYLTTAPLAGFISYYLYETSLSLFKEGLLLLLLIFIFLNQYIHPNLLYEIWPFPQLEWF